MHKAWKRHQDAENWVDINLALKKGLKFYQTRSNAIILHETLPAYCIPKAIMMETGQIIYDKVYASPQPPPKISLKHDWMKELGSEVVGDGKDSQQTQPKTKNQIVRTGRPVSTEPPSRSSVQEIAKRSLIGCESTNVSVECSDKDKDAEKNVDAVRVRTVRPVGSGQSIDLFTQCEDIHIDFRVSGLPHAVVIQAENFRVRELVKKMQQSNAYNPFSEESKEDD